MKVRKLISGILASVIAAICVLCFVKVSKAADFTDELKVGSFGLTSSYAEKSYTSSESGTVYTIKAMKSSANAIQINSKNNLGLVVTNSSKYVKKISVTFNSSTTKTLQVYAKNTSYTATSELYAANTAGTEIEGGITKDKTEIEFTDNYQYIGLKSGSGAMYLDSITIVWSDTPVASTASYKVSFDAGNAQFVAGKGEEITGETGKDTQVVLPTAEDLNYDVKDLMPLTGWTDGTTTHEPGVTVTVSANTTFIAVFGGVDRIITVEEACKIANFVGTTPTTTNFSVQGIVSKSNSASNFIMADENGNKFTAFNVKGEKPEVGDEVIVTGPIMLYNSNTPEINGGTYEKVALTGEKAFQKVETKTSLAFNWSTADSETYTVTNVKLRFGNLFSKDAYVEGATYGVLVIKNSDLSGSNFVTYLSGKTIADINADANIKNAVVETTPAKVNAAGEADEAGEYYQFAAVLEDMDTAITEEFTAVMYMIVDDKIYYTVEKSSSVKLTAEEYYLASSDLGLDANVTDALYALATTE